MLCVYFFFRLVPKEKDTKKKGTPATSPVLLRHCHSQTGLELASLRQIAPLFCWMRSNCVLYVWEHYFIYY